MSLRTYLLKRGINTIILIFFVITLNFIIFQLMPGLNGALLLLAGQAEAVSPETRRAQLVQFGFCADFDPNGNCIAASVWDRYLIYVQNMLTFQFGFSQQTGKSITAELFTSGRLINTLTLLGTATAASLIVGVFLGVYVASKRGRMFDTAWVITSLTTFSLPSFFMGILFIIIFAQSLHWFPSGGVTPATWIISRPPFFEQILQRLQHLFLPAMTLTLFFYGGNLLLTRATMLEALGEDYVVTARAKGLKERTVLFKHALKNASLPIVTSAALSFGFLLTGAIITETVFNYFGLGRWLFDAIQWKDFPVMQAMFYIIALMVIIANLIADVIYGVIDPRIKYE